MVYARLGKLGYQTKDLPAGIVLTGGVTKLDGIKEIAEYELNLPVRIGEPKVLGANNPIYTTSVGILRYVHSNELQQMVAEKNTNSSVTGLFTRIKEWFLDFFE